MFSSGYQIYVMQKWFIYQLHIIFEQLTLYIHKECIEQLKKNRVNC